MNTSKRPIPDGCKVTYVFEKIKEEAGKLGEHLPVHQPYKQPANIKEEFAKPSTTNDHNPSILHKRPKLFQQNDFTGTGINTARMI